MKVNQALGLVQQRVQELEGSKPSWKHRRRLIYGATILGAVMILVGILSVAWDEYGWDRQATSELIIGGVALISIVLTAYVGGASYEDTRLWKEPSHADYTENPE